MIAIANLISIVEQKFPEFKITEEMRGLNTVIFAFLTVDLIEAIKIRNESFQLRFAELVNQMTDSNDDNIGACIDEVFLGISSLSEQELNFFIKNLSIKARSRFEYTLVLWNYPKVLPNQHPLT